jgi:hypothetical protein
MRWFNWRRAIALVAMVVGIGAAASAAPASAAVHSHQVITSPTSDFWW